MGKTKTILVIDDEKDLRETVQYLFKSQGFNVVCAGDGLEGLNELKTITPDLIILDMNMPRMSGLEFYTKIKGHDAKPKYPVLILTARANMEQLFKDLDVDGFMAKPFELDQLVEEAKTIIRRYSGTVEDILGSQEIRARRICIVENDRTIFAKLAVTFLEAGYVVNSASSGASAIKRIIMEVPDVAVIKLNLADIAGDVVISKLKGNEKTKDVKYVLYTNNMGIDDNVSKNIALKEGVDNFVEFKDPNKLLEKIEVLF